MRWTNGGIQWVPAAKLLSYTLNSKVFGVFSLSIPTLGILPRRGPGTQAAIRASCEGDRWRHPLSEAFKGIRQGLGSTLKSRFKLLLVGFLP